jgi:hypothetical protein
MTMIENMKNQSYPRRVGDDRIMRRGEQLIVCSKVDMEEWQVQQNRKTAILIDDEVWCLVGKQYKAAKEVRYFLDPWGNGDEPQQSVDKTEDTSDIAR